MGGGNRIDDHTGLRCEQQHRLRQANVPRSSFLIFSSKQILHHVEGIGCKMVVEIDIFSRPMASAFSISCVLGTKK